MSNETQQTAESRGVMTSDEDGLPRFQPTHADDVEAYWEAWRAVDGRQQRNRWQLAAIAGTLQRMGGGRPRGERARLKTRIQHFCRQVGIARSTFSRYSRTYLTFAQSCPTGETRFFPNLSFQHHAVAAAHFRDEASEARGLLAEAGKRGLSANELAAWIRKLKKCGPTDDGEPGPRPSPKPFDLRTACRRLDDLVMRTISKWPMEQRRHAIAVLQIVVERLDRDLPLTEQEPNRWLEDDDAPTEQERESARAFDEVTAEVFGDPTGGM